MAFLEPASQEFDSADFCGAETDGLVPGLTECVASAASEFWSGPRKAYQRTASKSFRMCDCYDEELEDLPVAAQEAEPTLKVVPPLVVRKRR